MKKPEFKSKKLNGLSKEELNREAILAARKYSLSFRPANSSSCGGKVGGKISGAMNVKSGHWSRVQKLAIKSSNISRDLKALERKKVITNQLPLNEEFTSGIVRKLCEEAGEHHALWKGILKEERLIKKVHHGPNQFNPSRYIRIT